MNECQKLIRENIYNSKEHDGANVYQFNDERSFLIEPLYSINDNSKQK